MGRDSAAKLEYRGEHPGSGAGPGVVQQHVFKYIPTHSLTNGVKRYNPDTGFKKIVKLICTLKYLFSSLLIKRRIIRVVYLIASCVFHTTSLVERLNAGVHHAIQRSGLEREKLSRMTFHWYE